MTTEADVIVPLGMLGEVTVTINGFPTRMRVSHQQPGRDYSICTYVAIGAPPGPLRSLLVKYPEPGYPY